ncbi:MAG: hypothetical protein AB7H97_18280 [Pseudobdellovibrionaceae bacterium]
MDDSVAAGLGTANTNCQNLANSFCIEGDALQGCPKAENKNAPPDPEAKVDPPTSAATPPRAAAPKSTSTPVRPGGSSTPPQGHSAKATQQQCDDSARAVEDCCSHPERCGGATSPVAPVANNQSMNDYCNQMNNAAARNASANNAAAESCKSRIQTCSVTCNSAGDSETAQGCLSQNSKWQNLVSQAKTSAGSGLSGDQCKNLSQAQPQSGGGPGGMPQMPQNQNSDDPNNASTNPNDPTGCLTNPTGAQCQKCTANPNDPSCGTPMAKGQTSFSEDPSTPMDKSGFDVPSVGSPQRSMFDMASADTQSQPAKNGTIPNNTGGGVGGGGGGGSASLGGGQRRPGQGGGGVSTDILQGNMPGGYTTSPGGSADTEGGGGWGGYGGRMPASADGKGMDLKQFLPGQRNAPAFVGGAYSMRSAEIAGKHGDIFEKITRKFHEKCLKGQLIGCDH